MEPRPGRRKGQIAMLLGANVLAGIVPAEVITDQETESRLRSWTWSHDGVSIQLLQLLPDQTRAFFLGRGFGREEADQIGRTCVFQTIFRNDGVRPVEYDLRTWSVRHRTGRLRLRTREVWDPEWATRGVNEAARTAFRWALLPSVQRFEPGDYNWGMTSFGLLPGERFDLLLIVSIDDEPVAAEVPSVVCVADR